MGTFADIPGIGPRLIDLLSAAGFEAPEDFGELSSEAVRVHLEEANKHHSLVRVLPTVSQIESWRGKSSSPGVASVAQVEDRSNAEDIVALLPQAPECLVVPTQSLAEHKIAPETISEPIYLDQVPVGLELRFARRSAVRREAVQRIEAGATAPESKEADDKRELERDRIRSVEEFLTDEDKARIAKEKSSPENKERDQRVKLMTQTRPETNKGVNPKSRRFIKGVLHPLPGRMYFGAFISILAIVLIPLAIFAGFGLFINDILEKPLMPWLPSWVIAFPIALPIVGLIYVIAANQCRCRVCGQKNYLPKNCKKHRNAHHLPVIGYILPTSLHILSFKWFRCIFCGTPIRLKE